MTKTAHDFLHAEGREWLLGHLAQFHSGVTQMTDANLVVAHEVSHGNRTHAEALATPVYYHGLDTTPHDAIRLLMVRQGGIPLERCWNQVARVETPRS
jgi:hypothetical protein